jgi:adenylate cyclase
LRLPRIPSLIAHLAIALAAGGLCLLAWHMGWGTRLELVTYDARFRLRGPVAAHPDIVLLDIDDRSVETLGEFPIPRRHYAQALRMLREHGAAVVGMDIFFTEEQPALTSFDEDRALERLTALPQNERTDERLTDAFDRAFSGAEPRMAEEARAQGRTFFPAYLSGLRDTGEGRGTFLPDRALLLRRRRAARAEAEILYQTLISDEALFNEWLGRTAATRDEIQAKVLRLNEASASRPKEAVPFEVWEAVEQIHDENEESLVRSLADPNRFEESARAIGLRTPERIARARRFFDNLHWTEVLISRYEESGGKVPFAVFAEEAVGPGVWKQYVARFRTRDRLLKRWMFARRAPDAPPGLDGFPHVHDAIIPIVPLAEASYSLVSANFEPDPDGTVRRLPTALVRLDDRDINAGGAGRLLPSLSLAVALAALDVQVGRIDIRSGREIFVPDALVPGEAQRRDLSIPVDRRGHMLINWCGGFKAGFRHESFAQLVDIDPTSADAAGGADAPSRRAVELAESLKGKIVLIGLTATASHDMNPTPFEGRYPMVGAHANAIDTILRGRFLRRAPAWADFTAILGGAALLALVLWPVRRAWGAALALAMAAAYAALAYMLFVRAGIWLNFVYAEAAILLAAAGMFVYRYAVEERGRREVRHVLGHYLSPQVVEEALINVDNIAQLGGEDELTIWFSDIAGFSSVCERVRDPDRIIRMMRIYFDTICAPLSESRAVIDKFIGDAIVAFWNATPKVENHAATACLAAFKARALERVLAEKLKADGYEPLRTRIGINTGRAFYGNMGSTAKLNYSVLGDAVNLASRLEGANKLYGTQVMLGERTREMAGRLIVARELDLLRVVGRREPVRVYEMLGLPGMPLGPVAEALPHYEAGLAAYRTRAFADALAAFEKALAVRSEDGPSRVYAGRCRAFMAAPPPPEWDGVYEAETK